MGKGLPFLLRDTENNWLDLGFFSFPFGDIETRTQCLHTELLLNTFSVFYFETEFH